jgi:predicted dehydrogenase
MARAMFGADPSQVQAWRLAEAQTIQAAIARYQYGGVSLVSMMSWLSPVRRRQVTIAAERGVLVFDDRAPQKLALHATDDATSYPSYDVALPLTREPAAFVDLVRSGSSDVSDTGLGLAIVQAIAAAGESISNGGAIVRIGM